MTDPATELYRQRADVLADEAGSGPEILCAHGTLMDRTMFAPQLDGLANEYRLAAYDLRARTERFADPYDLWDLVEDCGAVMDGLEMERPVVVGMSMGGFMALRLALEYPDRVAGLVLIDSIADPHPDEDRELYRGMVEEIRSDESVPENMAQTVTHFLFGETTREQRPALVERWVDRWQTYPGEAVYNEVLSWLDRDGIADELAALDVPALAIHGEDDASLDVAQTESMVDALDADLEVIPAAGHSANLEQPEPVNEAVREFVDESANQPSTRD